MFHIIDNPYDHLPLNDKNISNYVLANELNAQNLRIVKTKELEITPFLQNDFTELTHDCVFTSIVTCVHYFYPDINPQDIYDVALAIYRRDYPSFQKIKGVIPFAIKHLYGETYKFFKLKFYTPKSRYVNHIGFNYNTIKYQLDQNIPVILSIFHDGRKLYKNHTVTIIGYIEFEMDNNVPVIEHFKPIKKKNMVMIYDNWSTEVRYVDLEQLSFISSIVF